MADLGTILRAAPLGLLMFLGSYLARRRRVNGRKRAVTALPTVAARLGLRYREPSAPGGVGALSGSYRGFDVFVESDERPRLVVYFTAAPPVVLRSYEHEKRTPNGMERLSLGRGLGRLFKEQFAGPRLAAALASEETEAELARRLQPLDGPHRQHLSITPERLELTLDFGRPPHVPPEVVEALVPAAVGVSELLETLSSEAPAAP